MATKDQIKVGGVYSRSGVFNQDIETCSVCKRVTDIRLVSKYKDNVFNYVCAVCGKRPDEPCYSSFLNSCAFAERLIVKQSKFAALKKMMEEQ